MFSEALLSAKQTGLIPVIPDIKRRSPQEGDLFKGRNPVETAKLLRQAGATVLSVVTEPHNYQGSLGLLEAVVQATGLPVLRKDFIKSSEDVKQTQACGAQAILLICALQPKPLLTKLFVEALGLGLEPLVEVHTKEELLWASELGAKLLGINNRDIQALERDDGTVTRTEQLAPYVPKGTVLISESAISTPREARRAIEAGADAVLIGTALWQAENMSETYAAFCRGA